MSKDDSGHPSKVEIRLLCVEDVLARLRIGRTTFYKLVHDKKLPLRKIGTATRVLSDDLDAYIRNLPPCGAGQ